MMRNWPAMVAALLVATAAAAASETASDARYHVLVANDDGVDAPGLAALVEVLAADPAYRVTVAAPARPQSGKGHGLTLEGEIEVHRHSPVADCPTWAVEATPATTVRVALSGLLATDPPDLVLSGINRGENVGRIAWYSGTVGAAREAVLAGFPALSFSLQLDWEDPRPDFDGAARWVKPLVDGVRRHGLPFGVFLNVNIPRDIEAIRGYRLTRMGLEPDAENGYSLDREEQGTLYFRSRWKPPTETWSGTDTRALTEGVVSIAPLGLDQTACSALVEVQHLATLSGPGQPGLSETPAPR